MSDDRIETHVGIEDPDTGERKAVHFQEYWIKYQASVPAFSVVPIGAADAKPGPGVLDAITDADLVILPPSNPVVSVGTILAVPGIRDALRATAAPVVGVSGIVGDDHVRGMARQVLGIIGVEVSAAGVAEHYGSRRGSTTGTGSTADGILDGWLVDTVDAASVDRIEAAGIRARAVPLMMTDHDATAAMVAHAIDLAGPRTS
jgi:LPPG:FO 2-phospho-L-lactate transferase